MLPDTELATSAKYACTALPTLPTTLLPLTLYALPAFNAYVALATVPFTLLPVILVNNEPLPVKKLLVTKLPPLTLPADKLPVISKLLNVPTLVIFG